MDLDRDSQQFYDCKEQFQAILKSLAVYCVFLGAKMIPLKRKPALSSAGFIFFVLKRPFSKVKESVQPFFSFFRTCKILTCNFETATRFFYCFTNFTFAPDSDRIK